MKRYVVIALVGIILAAAAPGLAGMREKGEFRECNPAGAWYELFGPPFMLNVTPIQGHSRYSLTFEGNWNPEDLGFVTLTNFIGEMKKGYLGFDAAIIATGGMGETFPHYPVATLGVAGIAEFYGNCDTLRITWFDGVQMWPWPELPPAPESAPPVPFVDEPIYLDPEMNDVVEVYFRMMLPRN